MKKKVWTDIYIDIERLVYDNVNDLVVYREQLKIHSKINLDRVSTIHAVIFNELIDTNWPVSQQLHQRGAIC